MCIRDSHSDTGGITFYGRSDSVLKLSLIHIFKLCKAFLPGSGLVGKSLMRENTLKNDMLCFFQKVDERIELRGFDDARTPLTGLDFDEHAGRAG